MEFKIDGKILCIDLNNSKKEEILLVINTVYGVCNYFEDAGYKVLITTKNSKQVTNHK